MMGIWYVYDEYMVRFIKDIWYGTLWVSEYAITISIIMVIVFS